MISRRVPNYRYSLFYFLSGSHFTLGVTVFRPFRISFRPVRNDFRPFTRIFRPDRNNFRPVFNPLLSKRYPLLFLANRKEYNEKWNYD